MNCDAIAPFYVWIERAAFGTRLERHRLEFLNAADGARNALVLGDGDGRFLVLLAVTYPRLAIDCIELSAGMIGLAENRLAGEQRQRVRFVQGDALTTALPRPCYDVIYSHFFLDCFTLEQVALLASRVAKVSELGARWVISDFRHAEKGWRRLFTAAWIKTMYVFFKLVTQLEQQHLPDYRRVLREEGFRLLDERRSMFGLVVSECWQR